MAAVRSKVGTSAVVDDALALGSGVGLTDGLLLDAVVGMVGRASGGLSAVQPARDATRTLATTSRGTPTTVAWSRPVFG